MVEAKIFKTYIYSGGSVAETDNHGESICEPSLLLGSGSRGEARWRSIDGRRALHLK